MYNLPNEVLIHSYLIIRSFYITLSPVALAALWVFAHRRWPPAAAGSGWAKPNDIHAAALAASDKYISSGRMEMSFWSRAGHGWLAGYFFFHRSLFRKLQRHNVLCAQLTIFRPILFSNRPINVWVCVGGSSIDGWWLQCICAEYEYGVGIFIATSIEEWKWNEMCVDTHNDPTVRHRMECKYGCAYCHAHVLIKHLRSHTEYVQAWICARNCRGHVFYLQSILPFN